eukprot:COSAG01_NODE_65431_length_273_cov_0.770115_2_plen_20_part_01
MNKTPSTSVAFEDDECCLTS